MQRKLYKNFYSETMTNTSFRLIYLVLSDLTHSLRVSAVCIYECLAGG